MAHPASRGHSQSQCDCTFDENGVQCAVVESVSNPGAMGELQCLIGRVIGTGSAKVNHGFGECVGNLKCVRRNGFVEGKYSKPRIHLNVDKNGLNGTNY